MDESEQIRPPVRYRRIFDEVQKMLVSDFVHEYAVSMNDAFTVLVISPVDLIDLFHVRFARVPRQHFPIILDYLFQRVFRGAQQLQNVWKTFQLFATTIVNKSRVECFGDQHFVGRSKNERNRTRGPRKKNACNYRNKVKSLVKKMCVYAVSCKTRTFVWLVLMCPIVNSLKNLVLSTRTKQHIEAIFDFYDIVITDIGN